MSEPAAGAGRAAAAAEERLLVAIRPRPLAAGEPADAGLRLEPGAEAGAPGAVHLVGEGLLPFDRVYAPDTGNEAVYADVAAPIVEAAVRGFSGAVAAYGQTGSGKTRTMRGTSDDPGIVPRAVRAVFAHVAAHPERQFLVSLAYLEIYNEQVKDLLNPAAKCDVVEGLTGVDVRGCRPTEVADLTAAMRLLVEGDSRRATAETAMNAASSRSHAVVRLTIESKPANAAMEGRGLVAVLSLVDLAGSETAKKTGVTGGVRALEGAKINQSLFALSRVIEALSRGDGSKPPFRDSKLTHLLKPALEPGANCKTAMICAVHPAAAHGSESKSTLDFARKARCVVTRPVVREELSERDRAQRLAAENEALQEALAAREAAAAAASIAAAAAAEAEAIAQRAEAAAAAERLVAVEAEAAELRARIAKMNAQAPLMLAAAESAAGGAGGAAEAAARLARRATLAGPATAAEAQAVSASAPPPARSGDADAAEEERNALLAALAAQHGATKKALAAAEAAAHAARMQADALQAERADADAAVAAAQAAVQEARAARAADAEAAEAARTEAAAATERAEEAAREAAAWRESAAKADARWLRAQHDTQAANDRVKASGAEGARARAEAEAATARAAIAEARAARAEADAAALTERLQRADAAAAAARAAASAAETAAAAAAKQAAAARSGDGDVAAAAAAAVAAAEARAQGAEMRATLLAGESEKLRSELVAARRDVWASGERAVEAEQVAVTQRAAAAAAEAARQRAEADAARRLAAAEADVAAAAAKEAAARAAAHDAAADLAASRADADALRRHLADMQSEVTSLQEIATAAEELMQEKEDADAALEAATAAADAAAAETAALKQALAAETAAREVAEQQLEAQIDEESARAASAAAEAATALAAAMDAAEAREAALRAQLARMAAAVALRAETPVPSPMPADDVACEDDTAEAPQQQQQQAPPVPPRAAAEAHWKAAPSDAARGESLERMRAVLAAHPPPAAPPAAPAATPARRSAAAAGGCTTAKAKCGVCPAGPKARVGAQPHPEFTHIAVCRACFGGKLGGEAGWADAAAWKDGAGQDTRCRVCADDDCADGDMLACDAGCGAAFCRPCVARHFPAEAPALAAAAAAGGAWACLLCRPECAERRYPARPQGVVGAAPPAAALAAAPPQPAAPEADKENAGAVPAAKAAPRGGRTAGTGTKRRLGPNRALEDESLA